MSDRPPVPMRAAHTSPTATRAARLAKFQREQLIVDYLNRGVSVAEIAAEIGIGEKRTRAVIRETLARRMPHPPEPPDPSPGVVAIQVSRLNEALLMAFNAMSPSNLKGIDQMVKIVRELDRYGGAFAAEWARPEAPPIRRPGARTSKDASLNVNLAPARDDRPENLAQRLEKVESAPAQLPLAPLQRGEGWPPDLIRGEGLRRLAVAAYRQAPHPNLLPVNGEKGPLDASSGDARPENPAQRLEKVESAPAQFPLAPLQRGEGWGEGPRRLAAAAHRPAPHPNLLPVNGEKGPLGASSGDSRPENLAQRLEKVESAPGIAPAAMAGADAGPSIANVAAHGSRPRAPTDCLARPPQGQGFAAAGSSGDARPENPPQRVENIESAPGIAPAAMASADAGLSIANAAARWTRSLEQAHGVAAEPRGRGLRPPPRRATLARKIRRNALKRLNPRPGGAASGGGSSAARRSPSRIGPRSVRATLGGAMAC